MNLHGIASSAIGSVNPQIAATVRYSTGSTPAPGGKLTPTYNDVPGQMIQMQALSGKDLMMLANLNIQGVQRAIYMYGDTQGVVRVLAKGGDLIVIGVPAPQEAIGIWKVVTVMETWPGWSKVGVTLQVA
ncbi:MAG: hypothetical protein JWP38_3740 [Herbaspirillum sp.]|nr:hypothetical protein [Herbaspirillum sp.]